MRHSKAGSAMMEANLEVKIVLVVQGCGLLSGREWVSNGAIHDSRAGCSALALTAGPFVLIDVHAGVTRSRLSSSECLDGGSCWPDQRLQRESVESKGPRLAKV